MSLGLLLEQLPIIAGGQPDDYNLVLQGLATSNAARPIEPVDPKMTIRLLMHYLIYIHAAGLCISGG